MGPYISISRNTRLSCYSSTLFKPTLQNQLALAKDMTQSLHTESDFENKMQHLCTVPFANNKSATFLYTCPPQNNYRIVIAFKDNLTYAQI